MTEELILRFFQKECSPEEADEVIAFFNRHPHLADKYLPADEWNNIDPVQMDQQFWDDIWLEIGRNKKASGKILWLRKTAIAAAITAAIAVPIIFFNKPQTNQHTASEAPLLIQEQRIRLNNTNAPISVALNDGSTVLLSPGSFITFKEPFDDDKRHIQLEGEGRFKVMTDSLRPFTVFAGSIATTALGTEFTINTHSDGDKHISVQLHEGKVVIKEVSGKRKPSKDDIFLHPGQQVVYDLAASNPIVSKIGPKIKEPVAKNPPRKSRSKIIDERGELSFVNTSLAEVLSTIEKHFHTKIIYDSADLSKKNFTGNISRNDSLSIVLKVITQMNELEMAEEEGVYIIKQ